MRASRLIELLVRLQVRGGASATELATEFEVSVRTIYRDVQALSGAGVPIYTQVGRNGGVRIDPSYRIAGLPRLDDDEARGVLFSAVPAIADELGLDAAVADRTILPAMEQGAARAARVVRDHLIVEPTHWFVAPDDTPALEEVAKSVWESREVRLTYRGSNVLVQPLGLILKGDTWYMLGRARGAGRLFRLSRIDAVKVLDQRFDRPAGFDLAEAWAAHRKAFLDSMIPDYSVHVRVAPAAEALLAMLDEGSPDLPLPADVERDEHGWAHLCLQFESRDRATRHLLRLGADVEVLDPPELRVRLANVAARLVAQYGT